MQRTALIIGATGLVGKSLLIQLASLYQKVIIISRSPPKEFDEAMHFYQLKDFSQIYDFIDNLTLHQDIDAFSCLGTTLKQAGNEEAFRAVDYEYNLNFARACHKKGIQRFFLLSAMGANPNSRFFYSRVKGELEQAIIDIGFEQLAIFRPSLLLGQHTDRPWENFAQTAFKMLKPIMPKNLSVRPIEAERVAMAMALVANNWYIMDIYTNTTYRHSRLPKLKLFSNSDMLIITRFQS